ncbi:MAG: hypothetical protein HHJ12_18635 [Glaciimonas sp.]|nr:hypothetical protein [Glaciimonas sp.]
MTGFLTRINKNEICIKMYKNEPILASAWIYIAIDISNLSKCKIGLTTMNNPGDRVKRGVTANPFYRLFNSYDLSKIGVSKKELTDFERYLHRKVGCRIPMNGSGEMSEWIYETPFNTEKEIEFHIANCFHCDGKSLLDEYGKVDYQIINQLSVKNRPSPEHIVDLYQYETCKEYVDYLIHYHHY